MKNLHELAAEYNLYAYENIPSDFDKSKIDNKKKYTRVFVVMQSYRNRCFLAVLDSRQRN